MTLFTYLSMVSAVLYIYERFPLRNASLEIVFEVVGKRVQDDGTKTISVFFTSVIFSANNCILGKVIVNIP